MAEDFVHENLGMVVAKLWDIFPNKEVGYINGIVGDERNGPFCHRDHHEDGGVECQTCEVWTQNCLMIMMDNRPAADPIFSDDEDNDETFQNIASPDDDSMRNTASPDEAIQNIASPSDSQAGYDTTLETLDDEDDEQQEPNHPADGQEAVVVEEVDFLPAHDPFEFADPGTPEAVANIEGNMAGNNVQQQQAVVQQEQEQEQQQRVIRQEQQEVQHQPAFGQEQQEQQQPVVPQAQQVQHQPAFGQEQQVQHQPVFGQAQQVQNQQVFGQAQQVQYQPVFGQAQQVQHQPVFGQAQQMQHQPVVPQAQQVQHQPVVRQAQQVHQQPVIPQPQQVQQQPVVPQAQQLQQQPVFAQEQQLQQQPVFAQEQQLQQQPVVRPEQQLQQDPVVRPEQQLQQGPVVRPEQQLQQDPVVRPEQQLQQDPVVRPEQQLQQNPVVRQAQQLLVKQQEQQGAGGKAHHQHQQQQQLVQQQMGNNQQQQPVVTQKLVAFAASSSSNSNGATPVAGDAAGAGSSGWKPSDPLSNAKLEVTDIFPDIDREFLHSELVKIQRRSQCPQHPWPPGATLVSVAVDKFMDEGYTKLQKKKPPMRGGSVQATSKTASTSKIASKSDNSEKKTKKSQGGVNWLDWRTIKSSVADDHIMFYRQDAKRDLKVEFPQVSCYTLDRLLSNFQYRYAPVYYILAHSWRNAFGEEQLCCNTRRAPPKSAFHIKCTDERFDIEANMETHLLKCRRPLSADCQGRNQQLQVEKEAAQRYLLEGGSASPTSPEAVTSINTSGDKPAAEGEEEDLYAGEEADMVECEICYCEVNIEKMVQCPDAHLFCFACVRNYAKESVYGSYAKAQIKCLDGECQQVYPVSQLERCLDEALLQKYHERQQEECLNVADLQNFYRCPNCEYGAIVPEGSKVLECNNPDCGMSTCKFCKVDWEEHIGVPCKEIEKKDETKLRLTYEEKMSEAKIRQCNKCRVQLVKSDGCNKMTCRCGAKMCYICRKAINDYSHFCQHVREPGRNCGTCQQCFLWSNADEDDARAIQEIKKEAYQKRAEEGYIDDKEIGAPSPAKKQRK